MHLLCAARLIYANHEHRIFACEDDGPQQILMLLTLAKTKKSFCFFLK